MDKTIIDAILEKAVYGAGASGGKFQRGSGKDESKPGTVKKPELSEERKKQIIEGARTKASHLASSTGMHGFAAKIKAEKSLDERTCDYIEKAHDKVPSKFFDKPEAERKRIVGEKALKNYYGPKDRGKYVPGSKTYNNPQDSQDPKIRYKSLDERTCDLTKDISQQRSKEIHDAVSTVRMVKEDIPEAAKMDVNPDDVHRAFSLHSNLTKPQTQKSICDKWQTDSAFITKGARVMPLGPGGEVSTLSKDEDSKKKMIIASHPGQRRDRTSTEPSYNELEAKMNEIQEGKINKRAAKMKDVFGAE